MLGFLEDVVNQFPNPQVDDSVDPRLVLIRRYPIAPTALTRCVGEGWTSERSLREAIQDDFGQMTGDVEEDLGLGISRRSRRWNGHSISSEALPEVESVNP